MWSNNFYLNQCNKNWMLVNSKNDAINYQIYLFSMVFIDNYINIVSPFDGTYSEDKKRR